MSKPNPHIQITPHVWRDLFSITRNLINPLVVLLRLKNETVWMFRLDQQGFSVFPHENTTSAYTKNFWYKWRMIIKNATGIKLADIETRFISTRNASSQRDLKKIIPLVFSSQPHSVDNVIVEISCDSYLLVPVLNQGNINITKSVKNECSRPII